MYEDPYGKMSGIANPPDVPAFRFCQTTTVFLCDMCPYQKDRAGFDCMLTAAKDAEEFAGWLRAKRLKLIKDGLG